MIAVIENRADPEPRYIMWLKWCDSRIDLLRDYRYVRHVVEAAELALAADAKRRGESGAH